VEGRGDFYSKAEAGVSIERVPDLSFTQGSLERLASRSCTRFFGITHLVSTGGWSDHAERGRRAEREERGRRGGGRSEQATRTGRGGRRASNVGKSFRDGGRGKGDTAIDTSPGELGARIWSFELQVPLLGEIDDAVLVIIFEPGV
jgi:hypothetical protein